MVRIANLVTGTHQIALTVANNFAPNSPNNASLAVLIGIENVLPLHRVVQHGFYARPRLRLWSIVRFATFNHFDGVFGFATPRTPPLWQRGFFLINCLVLRRLLASARSGVVKTFR